MARQLPSLNGLRAFEAAGRHGSFTAAATELNVTQTAVSRMVRLLGATARFCTVPASRQRVGADGTRSGAVVGNDRRIRFDCKARRAGRGDAGRSRAHRGRRSDACSELAHSTFDALLSGTSANRGAHGDRRRDAHRCATTGPVLSAAMPARGRVTLPKSCSPAGWSRSVSPALAAELRNPASLRKATLIIVPHLASDWDRWFDAAGIRTTHSARWRGVFRQ